MFRRRVASCLLALVVVVSLLSVVPAVSAVSVTDSRADVSSHVRIISQQGTPINNTTVRQENPETVGEDGDLRQVQTNLARTLSTRLGESSIQISQGEYEQARRLLGDDYDRELGKYVDVAAETDSEATAERFQQASTQTREYATAVESYRETREAYRDARANGNTDRARALARDLEANATRVNQTANSLTETFTELNTTTGTDFSESTSRIEATQTDIQTATATIVQREFTETQLSVETADTVVSFTEPLRLSGQLTTANGTALTDRTVLLQIGEQTQLVETDATGSFTTVYRPTAVPTGEQAITVAYVPVGTSLFAGSSATVSVEVTAVTPTLQLSSIPEETAYNDRVVITGRVAAETTGAGAVPVTLSVDGVQLGSTTTAPNGSFTLQGRLPTTVRSGSHPLTVQIAQTDRALSRVQTRDSITVVETPTQLSLTADAVTAETIDLSGRLVTETASPTGVENAVVTLTQNGDTVRTVTTDGSGEFRLQLALAPVDNRTVTFTVAFDGTGTNLDSATVSTRVQLPAPTATGSTASGDTARRNAPPGSLLAALMASIRSAPLTVGGTLLGLAVFVVAGIVVIMRRPSPPGETDTDDAEAGSDETVSSHPSRVTSADTASRTFLTEATTQLQAGASEDAVRYAYAGVRTRLDTHAESTAGQQAGQTHWEFYETVAPTLSADHRAALQTLTERFERAAFTPDGIEPDEAEKSIETARSLIKSIE